MISTDDDYNVDSRRIASTKLDFVQSRAKDRVMVQGFSLSHAGVKELSVEPLVRDAQGYSFVRARKDLVAAVSVALLSVPQALAYSIVVGVPPMAAVISMILGTSIAALLCSSSHLVIGPNNATCLLVQAATMEAFQKIPGGSDLLTRDSLSMTLITVLTLLIGVTQLLASIFSLGRLIQFVSHAVIVGYIGGTAVAIMVGQLYPLAGLSCPECAESLYQKMVYFVMHITDVHLVTLGVGALSILMLVFLRSSRWKVPPSLTMLGLMTALVAFLGADSSVRLVGCGDVFFPSFSLQPPLLDLRLLNSLLPVAFAIALIGILEAHAIAKTIAAKTGQRVWGNQEAFALGTSNFFLSLFGGLPCSGSATRSIVNVEGGATTRFAALFSGGIVAVLIWALGPIITYVPRASLAALLIVTAVRLIDMAQVHLCWRATKSDAVVLVMTFLSCLFFSLPLAFYVGIALSIILYLRKASIPRVVEYIYEESTGEIHLAHEDEKRTPRAVRVINVEGELFFGAMDLFQHTLRAIAEDDMTTKVIILRLKHVHDLDATTALALRQLKDYLAQRGRHLIVYSIPAHVYELLENVRLIEHLGKDNVILFDPEDPHSSLTRSFARAQELLVSDRSPAVGQGSS
jgi:SulP family sulfate permease